VAAKDEAANDMVAKGNRRRKHVQQTPTAPPCNHAVMSMDPATGKSSKVFDVPSLRTLNGCQINPIDSIIYCVTDKYLVRFDRTTFRYVAKLQAGSVASTFSPKGIFYYEGIGYSGLYKTGRLENLPDYENADDAEIQNVAGISGTDAIVANLEGAQDMVFSTLDLEKDGSKEYLITLNVLWKVIVVKASTGKMWTLTSDGHDGLGSPMGFGSAWMLENRIFFAEDFSMGVFEVSNIDLAEKTATVSRIGGSSISTQNDGIQCPDTKIEPAWTTTTTTVATTTTTEESRRRRRTPVEEDSRRRRRTPEATEAPPTDAPTTTGKPVQQGECLPGFVKKTPCSCQQSVRCQRMK